MTVKDMILVVGGYGQVGSIICTRLSLTFPGHVIIAGRDYAKAHELSKHLSGTTPMQMDVYDAKKVPDYLVNVHMVIMCIDQKNTDFAEACLQNGVHYIDISPSYHILSRTKALDGPAKNALTTMLLGVGLCPGLSNLMVNRSRAYFDSVEEVNTYLMLGLGERHGGDGIQWLLNNLGADFTITEHGEEKKVRSFRDGKKTFLNEKTGTRTCYRFDLADQHIITEIQGLPNVSSRFCYDSPGVTRLIAFGRFIGFFTILHNQKVKKYTSILFARLLDIFHKYHIWTDSYAIKTEVTGKKEGKKIRSGCSIYGHNNTIITGTVAAILAETLYTNNLPSGAFYAEELFELTDVLGVVEKYLAVDFKETFELID